MLGLFGTLNLGVRSLQTQRQGIEIAGQNLANVNNTAYARQRVQIQTSATVTTAIGPQGTGADAVAIQQLRDAYMDRQITTEASVGGFLDAQQRTLQYAQADLGQQIGSSASGAAATDATSSVSGLADDLSGLFNGFQSLSTSPTSMAERQVLLSQAQNLATRFNQTDQRLGKLSASLDDSIATDVSSANKLLSDIASLNDQVATAESSGDAANDLRDLRQQKIEQLAKLTNLDASPDADGTVNISINGNLLVSGKNVLDTLQTYDAGSGQKLVRTATGATPLALTGGSIGGTIHVRDGALADLRSSANSLASLLISEVNTVHAAGFGLAGTNGADFFTGTDASSIGVNSALLGNPSLIQASGVAGAAGDNQVALALAQLADKRHAILNNQTFSEGYSQTVADLGQALSTVNGDVEDHAVLGSMLQRQRDSVSGVSIDEEMTDMVKYQKAFEASARLVTTVDEMLDTILNLKR